MAETPEAPQAASPASRLKDPVCGMLVDPATSKNRAEHKGQTAYFCSAGCRTKFIADPAKYLSPGATEAPAPSAPAGAIYTCPMHPQIRQTGPGSCPICGMALEPETITADAPDTAELNNMKRRLWVGGALAVPVVALEMGGQLTGLTQLLGAQFSNWLQLLFATPVVLWGGLPFFERGWQSLKSRNLNMFTLIALGTGAAWSYSIVATVFPGIVPAVGMSMSGATPVYFEAATVITVLVLVGQVLELRARAQTSGAIRALLNLAPKQAVRLTAAGGDETVSLDQVVTGDRLRVRPGDGVPVDGVVIEGASTLNESMVTGESLPVAKAKDDTVIAGTINQAGGFVMRATHVGSETMLARIVQLVASAQRSRAPIQRLADKVASGCVR